MLALTVLGSGSAGNCSALTVGEGCEGTSSRMLLFDAGLSMRDAAARLDLALGRRLDEVTDILLTHLDGDHWRPGWLRFIRRHAIRVHVHRGHYAAALAAGIPESALCPLDERRGAQDLGEGLQVEVIRTPHDDQGSTAMLLEWSHDASVARIGFATDLGRVPKALFECFRDLDLLALESNYDPELQAVSGRPARLKARITGGRGHLSNEASLEAARRVDQVSDLKAIVLLHLSRQCNCRKLVEALWRREAPELAERLVVSEQGAPAPTVVARMRPRRAGAMQREALLFEA